MKTAEEVYQFWFVDHTHDDWFGGKPEFDIKLEKEFTETHARVAAGEAWTWRQTPHGRLAEILVLDQFSRQLYRDQAKAFAQDQMALVLAQEAVASGHDRVLDAQGRMFIYMPYMHSESLVIHEEAMRLFTELGNENALDFEKRHYELIKRFGRYPKRNDALGRESTEEEKTYIAETDGFF